MRRILFVDDDLIRMTSHVEMLELSGFRVEQVTCAQKALERFGTHKEDYSCVILDIQMPPGEDFTEEETNFGRETGLVLLEKLRGIDTGIPIIALTVARDAQVRQRALSLGATKFLTKPVFPSTLIKILNELMVRQGT